MKKIPGSWRRYVADFMAILFPELCACCAAPLQNGEGLICPNCHFTFPLTGYETQHDNPVSRLFWGRAGVEDATAFLHFQKGGGVQQLIHQLKYKGRKEVGWEAGKMFGLVLRDSPLFNSCDCIIPVPLHPTKLRERGFNQSEWIGRGMSHVLHIPVDTGSLLRISRSETQTRKSRFDRWKNVEEIFALDSRASLSGKHILLTDDVVTTGATLEACVHTLKQAGAVKVSIAVLAVSRI
ncbi:MAG TPA: ComF family protein [Bacteroidia bacterium]|jgi:ComF family protein|nr:ComF family protein [Bacteroidia bacterium]